MTDKTYITDLGIAVAGSVDSGKSTFVGVLTSGKLDDGDGSARIGVAKHPHEVQAKKTSDISTKAVITKNNKAITLFDLCGHDKYFKTTAYGISGHYPDYGFVIIGANKGILPMTKQHVTTLLSMNIPIIFIVTRYDITPQNIYAETIKMINTYCKNIVKLPAEFINSPYNQLHNEQSYKEDKIKYINNVCFFENNRQIAVPIITVSNKNGYYIDFINDVLSILKPRDPWKNFDDDTTKQIEERCTNRVIKKFLTNMDKNIFANSSNNTDHVFFVDTIYNPIGIGLVITGINRGGIVNVGDTFYLGPFGKEFKEIRIKSMNNYVKQKIFTADSHHRITIAVGTTDKDVNKHTVRKGMVMLKSKELIKKYLTFNFNAVITLFSHSATLKNGYTPSLQIGNVRQSARMILNKDLNSDKDHVKLKEFAIVSFKLKQRPEYIEPYQTFIFRSGCVHGVGVVTSVLPLAMDPDAKPDPVKKSKKSIKSTKPMKSA
jgi:elongation factor 1-alpha